MNEYWSSHLKLSKKELLEGIRKISSSFDGNITLMEVCGGHTNTIMRYGIRKILPENISLISGPGCPVCVTSQQDIDAIVEIALNKIPVATYGDMLRVPGTKMSLEKAREQGANVNIVYSAADVIELKKNFPEIVFFGIGFETTAPMSAFLLEKNIPVYSTHKLIVPAMEALLQGKVNIDGFILPGHVSSIIGLTQYEKLKVPQAVCGFEPEHLLRGIYALVNLISNGKSMVINTYPEVVRSEGNKKAQDIIQKHFKVTDSKWRGLGNIPSSGLDVVNPTLDAKKIYSSIIEKSLISKESNNKCRCGDVLKGLLKPEDCPLFSGACTPETPLGACMVSSEGACNIHYNSQ